MARGWACLRGAVWGGSEILSQQSVAVLLRADGRPFKLPWSLADIPFAIGTEIELEFDVLLNINQKNES